MSLNLDLLTAIPGQAMLLWLVLHLIASVLIGLQLAVAARMHPVGAIALSVLVPALGPLILLIVALVRRSSPDAIEARAQSVLAQPSAVGSGIPSHHGSTVQMGGWTMQTGAPATPTTSATPVAHSPATAPAFGAPPQAGVFGGGTASAPFGGAPKPQQSAFPAAPAGMLPRGKGNVRISVPIVLGVITIAVIVTGLLPWISLIIGPAFFGFRPLATQLSIIVVFQILLLIAAVFLSLRAPSAYGAALSTIASTNLLYLTILSLLIASPLTAIAQQVNDSDLSLSDAAAAFGIDASELQETLPESLTVDDLAGGITDQLGDEFGGFTELGEELGGLSDLGGSIGELSEGVGELGFDADSIDPDEMNVFDAIPTIQLNIDLSIWLAMAVSVAALGWAVTETVLVVRRGRSWQG